MRAEGETVDFQWMAFIRRREEDEMHAKIYERKSCVTSLSLLTGVQAARTRTMLLEKVTSL